MNRSDWLSDELLEGAFQLRAGRGSLGGLRAGVVSATAVAGQRSVWRLRLAALVPAPTPRPALLTLLLLGALLAVALVIALAGRRPPNQFTIGSLAFVRGGDVYLADPDGSNARVVLHENGILFSTVAWSRDGSKLVVDGESGVVLLDIASGAPRLVGGHAPTWSPDGLDLAVIIRPDAQPAKLRIIEPDTGAIRAEFPFIAENGLAWSPNGRWIAATGDCTGPLCPAGATSAANAVIRIDVRTGEVIEVDGRSGHLDAARQVAWSPDSRRIAYTRYAMDAGSRTSGDPLSDVRDVIVADADGSNDVRINRQHGRADLPAWSPDGRWIAFRDRNSLVMQHPDGTGDPSIVEMPAPLQRPQTFAWGPASDRLWFTLEQGFDTTSAIWEASLTGAVRSLGISFDASSQFGTTGLGFGFQVLADGQPAPPLPSGVSNTPFPTMDVVTPPPAVDADPSGTWSNLLTESSDLCELLIIATADGAASHIADLCDRPVTNASSGSWSPTGAEYAIVRDGRLSVLYVDGRAPLDVGDVEGANGVTWSPDGIWLSTSGTSTYLLRSDGSDVRRLPGSVSWSPDGQTLAVSSPDGSLLIGPGSGVQLSPIGTFPLPATWSPDGSRFGFVRDGDIWTAASDGTDIRNITSLPLGGASWATWSPDGRWIAVTANHGLWLIRADGSERRWLDLGSGESTYEARWSPDSSRLAFSTYGPPTASRQSVHTYIAYTDGSPTTRIDETWSPSWSPDGRYLVAAAEPAADDASRGSLVVMNADGSGRRVLRAEGFGNTPIWVR